MQKKYQVDVTKFDFTGLFVIEGEIEYSEILLVLFLLPLWVLKMLVAILLSPFQKKRALTVREFSLTDIFIAYAKARPIAGVLTTGDFVASAAAGYFVKRERVKFKLIK